MKFLTDFNCWYENINWLDFVVTKYYFIKLKKKNSSIRIGFLYTICTLNINIIHIATTDTV
jgi:hypothetical protein